MYSKFFLGSYEFFFCKYMLLSLFSVFLQIFLLFFLNPVHINQHNQQMSLEKPKKWVEYSEESSSLQDSDSEVQETNPEVAKLKKVDENFQYVWLFIKCSRNDQASRNVMEEVRFKGQNNAVYRNDDKNGYDVKVDKRHALQLLLEGLHHIKSSDIHVHERNFKNRQARIRTQRRGNQKRLKDFRSEKKNLHEPRSRQKAVKYVDKKTGEAANNKINQIKREISEKERKYSRREAQAMGNQLGRFRKTPLEQRRKDMKNQDEVESEYLLNHDPAVQSETTEQHMRSLKSAPKKLWREKESSSKEINTSREKATQQRNKLHTKERRSINGNEWNIGKKYEKNQDDHRKKKYVEKYHHKNNLMSEDEPSEYYDQGQKVKLQRNHQKQ